MNDGSLSIVLVGEAGQGLQTVESLLVRLLKLSGYYTFSTNEFMSRIRGGYNSSEIRVGATPIFAYVSHTDLLLPLKQGSITHVEKRIDRRTIIIGEAEIIGQDAHDNPYIEIAFSKLAEEIGGKIFTNMIASGVICGLLNADLEAINSYLAHFFSKKGDEIIKQNQDAVKKGYDLGNALLTSGKIPIAIPRNPAFTGLISLSGTEAIGLGALAGGCNFISSYPMSPSTGVLVFLSSQSQPFGIIAEQAEDEISAINMAIGAWYAGARAMVTTSGGGFALMVEGLSLAGVTESPVVIHLAQRPGPGTGLPTRTEQGDLLFALFAGHGAFPRILLSPGSAEDGFYLAQKAFNLADKYQVPVFLLTDQYFLDSTYCIEPLDPQKTPVEKHIVKTTADYKRYQLTESGLSPRGIPGYGDGVVQVDSDEHDEAGHITENHDVRISMVKKRLQRFELLTTDTIPPELIGAEDYKTLVICWGSTFYAVQEALGILGKKDLAALHFKQVFPLPTNTSDYLQKAQTLILLENNATGQLGQLLKLELSIDIPAKILKYNGLPFSVNEIVTELRRIIS